MASDGPPGGYPPGLPAGLKIALADWRAACRDAEAGGSEPWRELEASALLTAVLWHLGGDDRRHVEPAARMWAKTIRSLTVLASRLACLSQVLTAGSAADADGQLRAVLDAVTTTATQAKLAELEDAALTDSLTGAGNRRALQTAATAALAESSRAGHSVSVAVIDLDGLKSINDAEGHAAGDSALLALASTVRFALRTTDQLFRIGGDEFVVLLPLAAEDTVAHFMARVEQLGAPRFSWGAAGAPSDATDLESLLEVADSRLYAKRRAAGYQRAGTRQTWASGGPPRSRRSAQSHVARSVAVALLSAGAVAAIVLVAGSQGKASPSNTGSPGSLTTPTARSTGGAGDQKTNTPGRSSSGAPGISDTSGTEGPNRTTRTTGTSGTTGSTTGSTGTTGTAGSSGNSGSGDTTATTTTAPGTLPSTTLPGTLPTQTDGTSADQGSIPGSGTGSTNSTTTTTTTTTPLIDLPIATGGLPLG